MLMAFDHISCASQICFIIKYNTYCCAYMYTSRNGELASMYCSTYTVIVILQKYAYAHPFGTSCPQIMYHMSIIKLFDNMIILHIRKIDRIELYKDKAERIFNLNYIYIIDGNTE